MVDLKADRCTQFSLQREGGREEGREESYLLSSRPSTKNNSI